MSQAVLELADLPLVLDQPHLGEHPGEVVRRGRRRRRPARSTTASTPRSTRVLPAPPSALVELVEVADLEAERVGDLLQRRAAAGPQLAVLPVAEELVGVARASAAGRRARDSPSSTTSTASLVWLPQK